MESAIQKVSFVSKKKNYETIEDAEIKDVIQSIKDNKENLTYISLQGNSYSKDFCLAFADLVKSSTNIERLNINDIFVSRNKEDIPPSIESITGSLIGKSKFVALDISNNAVSVNGAQALTHFLENSPNLKIFLINNCGLGIQGSTILAGALKKGKVNLEVIAMARNRLENQGTAEIASALNGMDAIREVYLFQDVIRKDGMIALLSALMDKKLKTLDISDNFINDESVEKFAEFLEKNETLENLNVSDCNVQKEDNKRIVEAFEKSKTKFQRVGYNHNELSDVELAKRFADTITSKSEKIQRLDIVGNEFRKAAKEYYREKFQEKKCLSAFDSDEEDEEDAENELAKEFSDMTI